MQCNTNARYSIALVVTSMVRTQDLLRQPVIQIWPRVLLVQVLDRRCRFARLLLFPIPQLCRLSFPFFPRDKQLEHAGHDHAREAKGERGVVADFIVWCLFRGVDEDWYKRRKDESCRDVLLAKASMA